MKKISDAISIVFIVVAAAFFAIAGSFPEGTNGAVGPGWFPRIMCVIIIVLSVINLVTTNIAYRQMTDEERQTDNSGLKIFSRDYAIVWISMGLTLVYVMCVQYVGFVVSSLVYILGMNIYYKVYQISKIATVAIPIAVTGILYYIFTNLLHVVLPSGILI